MTRRQVGEADAQVGEADAQTGKTDTQVGEADTKWSGLGPELAKSLAGLARWSGLPMAIW